MSKNRLDIIRSIISRNSNLGEIYKKYKKDDYINLLSKKLNIKNEDIYIDDIDSILYIYSDIPAQKWDEIIDQKIKNEEDIKKNIIDYDEYIKFKLIIKTDLNEYFNLHPNTNHIYEYINKLYNENEMKEFIQNYYLDNINQYIEYKSKIMNYDLTNNLTIQMSIFYNYDFEHASSKIFNMIKDDSVSLTQLISDQFNLYNILIECGIISIKLIIIGNCDIINLDSLNLKK